MKNVRLLRAALLGAVALVAVSCADPTTPVPQLRGDLFGDLKQLTGLLQCTPLPYDSVTEIIGPEGGTIQVGPHTFTVPAGALDTAVAITAVTPSDTINQIQFQPEGLVFNGFTTLRVHIANDNFGAVFCEEKSGSAPDTGAATSNNRDFVCKIKGTMHVKPRLLRSLIIAGLRNATSKKRSIGLTNLRFATQGFRFHSLSFFAAVP